MTDTTLRAIDGNSNPVDLLALNGPGGVLTPYHIEDSTQRAALLAELAVLATAISAGSVPEATAVTLLTTIRNSLATALHVVVDSLPLPTGAATDAKLEAIRALLDATQVVSLTGVVPLPTGAATELTVQAIVAGLADILEVNVNATVLPPNAATATAQADLLTAVSSRTFPVSLTTLPLPTGASSDSKLEDIRLILASGTLGVTQTSQPLPTGAASESKLEAIRVLLATPPSPTLAADASTETTLAAIKTLLAAGITVNQSSQPLPTGGASNAKLDDVITAINAPVSFSLPANAATEATLSAIATLIAGTLTVEQITQPLPDGAATDANLAAIISLLSAPQAVTQSSQPLPTGAAQQTTLAALLAALTGTPSVAVTSAPLPTGAATDAKLEMIRLLLASPLAITAASLPLPAGAATNGMLTTLNATLATLSTDVKLEAVRALLAGTLAISASALPLPAGAATDAKLELVRSLLAGTIAVSVASLPLPAGAATDATGAAGNVLLGPVTETAPTTDTASSGLNGRLQRIAQRLTSIVTLLSGTLAVSQTSQPLPTGAASDVTVSAGNTLIGPVTETAPTTDTASSGINGRLQRVSQRLSTLITAVGTPFQAGGALGAGTAIIGKVAIDQTTDGTTNAVVVKSVKLGAATGGNAGTITTGGTAQTLMVANTARLGATFQNTSSVNIMVSDKTSVTATSTGPYVIPPYATAIINTTDAISIYGTVTGQTFAWTEF